MKNLSSFERKIKEIKIKYPAFPLISLLLVLSFCIFSAGSCHYYKLEQKLDPENAEFLDKVRYIITSKERKIFLELPVSEKENFRQEFWKRRDPDPNTEENEFKIEYFNRIEKANENFRSEGIPGWLTDRGRIYILFGPPTDRISSPMSYDRCQEVWYYGNFPVVFIDQTCTGNYRLVTYDLSSIRSLNLMYMHELSMAQARAQQTIIGESRFFDFNWGVRKTLVEEDRIEGIVNVEVPFASIWFKEEEGKLRTTLDIRLELRDSEEELNWEYERSFDVVTNEEELKQEKSKKFETEIPFVLNKDIDRLRLGKNKIFIVLKNRTGGDEQRKVLEITFD